MTQYEMMKAAQSVLEMLAKNDVDMNDVKHIEMYDEFMRLKKEGHKVSYATYYLSQQYGVGQATVYRVVKRMEKKMQIV